jgi:hypothetical protein
VENYRNECIKYAYWTRGKKFRDQNGLTARIPAMSQTMPTASTEKRTRGTVSSKFVPRENMLATKPLVSESGAEISVMTEGQLERLLKRLAIITRDPRVLSQYATPALQISKNVSNVGQVKFLNPNKFRFAVLLSTNGPGVVSVGWGQPDIVLATGIIIRAAGDPTLWTFNDIGAAILGPLWAVSSALNTPLTIQEFQTPFPLDTGIGTWQR